MSKPVETRFFNLNSQVKVKLTRYGLEVLRNKHNELFKKEIQRGLLQYNFETNLDENGYYTAQMHYLMNMFGEYMVCSSPNRQVFETMEILIPKNSKTHCF